ncbi:MAG TPA: hypothetical protein DCF45_11725 [Gammaproteobacteria bacterium]|nr:hypothetical protein [Gammaproteobacteria bacterium]
MFKLNRLNSALAAVGLSAMIAAPAQAGEKELLDILLQNHVITADQHQALMDAYVEDSASDIKITTKGGLKAKSEDGNFTFQVGGRIMADATFGSDDNSSINDLNTGTEFRRARIFFKGTLNKDWAYKWQVDYADDNVSTKDMYINYKPMGLTIGQFKQPFSLEEKTSSKYITFMERALPNVFATGRRVGIGYDTAWDMGTFAASVYGQEAGNGDENEEGFGVGARLTLAPVNEAGNVLHFGIAAAQEEPGEGANDRVRVRARPDAHNSPRLVDTNNIANLGNVDDLTKVGIEGAWVAGPFSLQAEWMQMDLSRDSGFSDVDFDGWYAYASWFLTGESRPYSKGAFKRVKPNSQVGKGGMGAWELGLRFAELDLSDWDDVAAGVGLTGAHAGELETTTLGLNWYATKNVRFMMNYVMADAEYGVGVDDEPDVLQFRAQIDW